MKPRQGAQNRRVTPPQQLRAIHLSMDTQQTKFDWNAWYAGIPGIPADWGEDPIETALALVAKGFAVAEMPLLEAA